MRRPLDASISSMCNGSESLFCTNTHIQISTNHSPQYTDQQILQLQYKATCQQIITRLLIQQALYTQLKMHFEPCALYCHGSQWPLMPSVATEVRSANDYQRVVPLPPLDNIRVMVIVRRLRGNIIRTAPCWVVWHNVRIQQHTHMSSSYRSSRLCLSHWDSYAMHRGGCLELSYCNMVEWSWWDSDLICKTDWWFPSVLWHCWFGHMTCKNRPRYDL